MNDMDLLSTPHCVASKCTKSRYKAAPKAAPVFIPNGDFGTAEFRSDVPSEPAL
jgi:hypothetical protein